MQASNRRDGIRVSVIDNIESVIFAADGFPDFCDHFIINMGGLRLDHQIEHRQKQISIHLFHSNGNELTIDSEMIASSSESSVLKFSPLTHHQRTLLQNILMLQQASLPENDL
jgi:hypothetical protein